MAVDVVLVVLVVALCYVVVFRWLLTSHRSWRIGLVLAALAAAVVVRAVSLASQPPSLLRLTRGQLSAFKGVDGGPIYLAVAGRIYDVSAGRDHYGPGKG